jgi:hypothetical protein
VGKPPGFPLRPFPTSVGDRPMNPEDSLSRAEELLARLEKTRAELERLSQANDAEKALDVLTELSELSKAIEDELQKVKRNAETDAEP